MSPVITVSRQPKHIMTIETIHHKFWESVKLKFELANTVLAKSTNRDIKWVDTFSSYYIG